MWLEFPGRGDEIIKSYFRDVKFLHLFDTLPHFLCFLVIYCKVFGVYKVIHSHTDFCWWQQELCKKLKVSCSCIWDKNVD